MHLRPTNGRNGNNFRHQTNSDSGRTAEQPILQEEDMMLVKNHQVDNQRGRKFNARWLGARLLAKWANHKHRAWVQELHGTGKPKRFPIDDLILFKEKREATFFGGVQIATPTSNASNEQTLPSQDTSQAPRSAYVLPR